ncbi:MAG: integral membrane protein [Algoriphagus marincola HL-49]|uniref:Integral membrane protein n=1 Tax=Algoriphagus marincola HL-49 TaxID=1305737 RepID=A0A0P7Y4S1_9BACT|nr:MAG: integral membrane protein [Algoriphagus marincola HL-49]
MNTEQVKWAKRFKWISLIEGISFLVLLFIAMPLKYIYELPMAVTVVGWIHGVLFVIYIYVVFPTASKLKWDFSRTLFALIASVLPFGPFIFDRNLRKSQQVDF